MDCEITTVDQLVASFGGPSKTAALFETSVPAVCNWKARGRLPGAKHLRIYKECEARGLKVSPTLFEGSAA